MPNPNPGSEHVGNDGEGLYIDLGLQYPKPVNPEASPLDTSYDLDGFDESSSDEEDGVEDIDEIVKDREHAQKPELNYDKNGPPMAVETLYSDMSAFKLVLASHATKYEFHYNIKKSDKTRYTVYCSGKNVGCRLRLHASTVQDGCTVKVIFILSSLCIVLYFFLLQ